MTAREVKRRALIGAVVVLLVPLAVVSMAGDDLRSSDLPLVSSWVTSPDERELLTEQPAISFGERSESPSTIAVDPTEEYQVVDGFGASITDSSAAVLYRLDPPTRDATMVALFAPRRGAGLSYLRQPMGASDFVDEDPYTYDDVAPGETDYSMQHFGVDHDRTQILPLLRRAKALNPQLQIMATPWSAPAWMKTSGSLIGGSLVDDPRMYEAYALYFIRFLEAYAAAGVPVDAVTVQNEPQNSPADYPGMRMTPTQQAAFIAVLRPALRAAHLHPAVLAYDHNWALAPADAGAPRAVPAAAYVDQVLSDSAAGRGADGVAFHCYSGDPGAQADVHSRFPGAEIVVSECSGFRRPGETPADTFARTLGTMAQLIIGALRNWAAGFVTWNLALGPQHGPHRGGCETCTGVVTAGPQDEVTRNAEYFALAAVSRFVRPGAARIASTFFRRAGEEGGLSTVAFRDPDGSIALVVHNASGVPHQFSVRVGDRSFATSLPGGGLGTYTWPGGGTPAG